MNKYRISLMGKTLPRIIPTILIILCSKYLVFMYLTFKTKAIKERYRQVFLVEIWFVASRSVGNLLALRNFLVHSSQLILLSDLTSTTMLVSAQKKSWQMDVWPQLWAMAFLMKSLEKLQEKSLWPLLLSKVSTNLKSSGMAIYRQRENP